MQSQWLESKLTSNENVVRQHVMLGGFEGLAPINTWF